jgi:hypothetical protein
VNFLERVSKRRSIVLRENIGAHLNPEVGTYPNEPVVVGSMVDLAKGESVRDDRFAPFGVRDDVRGVEQLDVP